MTRVEPLTPARMGDAHAIQKAFLGSKHVCCCIPLSCGETEADLAKKYARAPTRMPMAGVAVGTDGQTVVGFIQVRLHGMPLLDEFEALMHTTKPGECYIETVAVNSAHRGQGAGGKMLEWSEAVARAHGATVLTLSVIKGNPARRLYERFGFVAQPQDGCESLSLAVFICCIMGRPYGCFHPDCGAVHMEKPLGGAPDSSRP